MPDPIEDYLAQVMRHARLAPADDRRVRAELRDHLHELFAGQPADNQNPKEILAMLNNEFGDPRNLGSSIAASKGRPRTYMKRQARRLSIAIAAILMLGLFVRATVAEAFYVAGSGVSPILTQGSRCIVYKLSTTFSPEDIVVYKPVDQPSLRLLAIVKDVDPATGNLRITRNKGVELAIPRSAVVGRVVLSTRK